MFPWGDRHIGSDWRLHPLSMGEVTPRVRSSPFIGGFSESHSVVSNSLRPHELYSPWNTPGQNTGDGSLSLLQGIFPTQGSNPGLPHCRQILYQPSHQGSIGGFSGRNRSLAQPLPGFILWTICPLSVHPVCSWAHLYASHCWAGPWRKWWVYCWDKY